MSDDLIARAERRVVLREGAYQPGEEDRILMRDLISKVATLQATLEQEQQDRDKWREAALTYQVEGGHHV